jgi:hypothetical protein
MVSQLSIIAMWAAALCLVCFAVLSNASDTPRHPHDKRDDKLRRRSVVSKLDEALKHHDVSHQVIDILTTANSQGT